MDRLLIRVFLQQAIRQCDYALIAEEDIRTSTDHTRIWYSLENFVFAVSKISKVFWSNKRKRTALRDLIGVTKESPLAQRDLLHEIRGAFEHFDERIDTWWDLAVRSGDLGVVDVNVGTGLPPDMRIHQWELSRTHEPQNGLLWFGFNVFNIWEFADEVRRIKPLIAAELERDSDIHALWAHHPIRAATASSTDQDAATPDE